MHSSGMLYEIFLEEVEYKLHRESGMGRREIYVEESSAQRQKVRDHRSCENKWGQGLGYVAGEERY